MRIRHFLWCSVLAASACGGNVDRGAPLELTREDQMPDEEPQGRLLTGDRVGFHAGRVDTFVAANGAAITDVRVDRAELKGRRGGVDVHAFGFMGAKFRGETDGGEALFTIEQVMLAPDDLLNSVKGANPEDPALGPGTYFYRVVVQLATSDPVHPWAAPQPLCAGDKLAAYAAPFAGTWKELGERDVTAGKFTLSCLSGVVAKCGILWGYKPWATPKHPDRTQAFDVHQSCVRAARADYCARGVPHTRDGTLIKITDLLTPEIRRDDGTKATGRSFEAAYGDIGARCLSHLRWLNMPDECHDETVVPPYMTELPG